MANEQCLILTSRGDPIAEGVMGGTKDGQMHVKVLYDEAESVAKHEVIQIVGMAEGSVPLQCVLVQQQGSVILLRVLGDLDATPRSNIRTPTRFESFIYPISGVWTGRRELTSVDISSGGLAFYSSEGLADGERVEVVIPVSSSPLLVQMEILSSEDLKNGRAFYKAQFVDLHRDQERMIREAVFSIQLENHARKMAKEKKR